MTAPSDIRDWVAHPLELRVTKDFQDIKYPLTFDLTLASKYSPALCVTAATPPHAFSVDAYKIALPAMVESFEKRLAKKDAR